jgi:hypothetical protein
MTDWLPQNPEIKTLMVSHARAHLRCPLAVAEAHVEAND